MHVGGSLLFYLGRRFYLVNQNPASNRGRPCPRRRTFFSMKKRCSTIGRKPERIYLLVEHARIAHWRALLEGKGLLVAELTTCGTTTLLSNRR